MKSPSRVLFLLCLVMVFSIPAWGLTGGDVSPAMPLETVSPTVQSVTAQTERSLSLTFSEPLLAPGGTTPGNYTVSGEGRGTLPLSPDTATGIGPHTLMWSGGEMRNGAAVTVTASGVQDAAGNPLLSAGAAASAVGMGVAPVFSGLSVMPFAASRGNVVTITFTASEPLNGDPGVTVNGHPAQWASGGKAANFVYTYTVGEEDAPGPVVVTVSGTDQAGNPGFLEDTLALTITNAGAGLPVRAWPLALLLGGIMVLVARRRMAGSLCGNVDAPSWRVLLGQRQPKKAAGSRFYIGRGNVDAPSRRVLHGDGPNAPAKKRSPWRFFLFLAAVLAAQTAFAAPPAVSNVSMVQRDNGAGGTEVVITYDLDAPNGPCDITVSLSKDGGADGYAFPVTAVTGDVSGVAGGAGKQIVWDIRADYPEEAMPNARIRVTADDGLVQHLLVYMAEPVGLVQGECVQVVNHGEDGMPVTAVPGEGYHFSQWSDGVLTAPRTDANRTVDTVVTAKFASVTATSFAIDSGAETTMPLGVTLNNTCGGAPTQYMASESPTFSGASWQAYGTAPAFTLSHGVGARTVYFKVRDAVLDESGVVSDTIFLVPSTVPVAAGSFDMGRLAGGMNDDRAYGWNVEDPVHAVTLGDYALGRHEVTNKEYCDVLNWALVQGYLITSTGAPWGGAGGIWFDGDGPGTMHAVPIVTFTSMSCNIQFVGGVFTPKTRVGLPGTTNYSMDTHPMVMVSWYGAAAYCNWLSEWQGLTPCYNTGAAGWPLVAAPPTVRGYRLPTEAEWERAAAWGETSPGSGTFKHWIYGFMSDTLGGAANSANCWTGAIFVNPLGLTTMPYTSPVGWFNGINVSPNGGVTTRDSRSPVGAYDMSGNVWEWCGDWYLDSYYGGSPAANPTGPAAGTGRVLRGGSWNFQSPYCRSAQRFTSTPNNTEYYYGFRVSVNTVSGPAVTSFAVNNGAETTTNPVVTLDNTAANGPTEYMASEVPDFSGAAWQAYGTSPSFTLSSGAGTRTVYFKVRNAFAESGVASDTILLEPPAPVVMSFAISNGAETTANTLVTLDNTATGSPMEYMASEAPDFSGAAWQAYGVSPAFTLSFGVGTRTVYFKARNGAGESAAVSDTIFLVPNMVPVAEGTFSMGRTSEGDDDAHGWNNELPVHSVTLGAYNLGKFEVTNKEYCDVLNWALAQGYLITSTGAPWAGTGEIYFDGDGPGVMAPVRLVGFPSEYCNITYSDGMFRSKIRVGLPGATNYSMDTHPMMMVTWQGAVAYCDWLSRWQGLTPCYDMTAADWPLVVAPPTVGGYRLPTEAEWERAAAWDGTKHWIYGFLSDTNTPGAQNRCNDGNSNDTFDNPLGLTTQPHTSPVGWFNGVNVNPNGGVATVNSPSPVGAYDMSGNVNEWCGDRYAQTYYGVSPASNPTGPDVSLLRITRGGSWYISAFGSRSAYRNFTIPRTPSSTVGFRVSRTPGVPPPAPAVISFAINNSAETTINPAVTLDNTAANGPTHCMASEDPGFSGASWQAYAASPSFTLSPGVGARTVYFKARNPFGESGVASDTILLEKPPVPAVVSFAINNGAESTTNPVVTLDNTATNAPTHYMASGDPDFSGASWQAYGTAPSFTLSADLGLRTVYFKVLNISVESSVVSDTILLEPVPEITSFAVNGGAVTTTNPVVALDNTATNSPTEYMASEDPDFSGASWQAYGTAPPFSLSGGAGGVRTVYFKARNEALAESAVVSDTIGLLVDMVERTILLPGDVPLVLVWIPEGSFQMGRYPGELDGSRWDDPQHLVTLARGFWMGKYEVTQQQWLAVRGSWPGPNKPNSNIGLGDMYPAYYISWDDVKTFVMALNAHIADSGLGPLTVRLPSEAEWEYACRAGTQTRFYWGDDLDSSQIGFYAWYGGNNAPYGSKPVGEKLPNAFGLHDMGGNVQEWCEDYYHESYVGAPTDGSAWTDSPTVTFARITRDGDFFSLPSISRCARHGGNSPGLRFPHFGFRLAAD